MSNLRGGLISLQIPSLHDKSLLCKGHFTFNPGVPKRKTVMSSSTAGPINYTLEPQEPYIEGEIFLDESVDINAILNLDNSLVVLQTFNQNIITLHSAWFSGDGEVNTEDSAMKVRFTGKSADVVNHKE